MKTSHLQGFCVVAMGTLFAMILGAPAIAFLRAPTPTPPEWRPVGTLSSVPDDGVPRLYSIVIDGEDAWNIRPDPIVWRLFIVREPNATAVRAFLPFSRRGSSIHYNEEKIAFQEGCWNVLFDLHGEPLREDDRFFIGNMIPINIQYRRGKVWVRADDLTNYRFMPI